MKILYFAQIKEIIGKSEESIKLENEISIKDLINKLKKRNSNYKSAFEKTSNLKFAINCEYADLNALIKDKDEIAFFPPVTGG